MSTITGTPDGEELVGDITDDTILGLGGDDTLFGADGADSLDGGEGDDTLVGGSRSELAVDTLTGGVGDDILVAGLADIADGGDGEDTLSLYFSLEKAAMTWDFDGSTTGSAVDVDVGHDLKVSNIEFVQLNTGSGGDTINTGDAHIFVASGAGDDTITGGVNNDFCRPSVGDDVIDGGDGFDRVSYFGSITGVKINLGLSGPQATSGAGIDTLINIEAVSGSAQADFLTGDGGINWLWGNGGNDTLAGAGGDDLLSASYGDQILSGGQGVDTVTFFPNRTTIRGGATVDLAVTTSQDVGFGSYRIVCVENLSGTIFADALTGNWKDNLLAGDAGNDTLVGAGGADRLFGDGYVDAVDPLYGLSAAPAASQEARADVLDISPTATFDDSLLGGNGADTVYGGLGDDVLVGGRGVDQLAGGVGEDVFVFLSAADSLAGLEDTITDLSDGDDAIDLSAVDADYTTVGVDEAFTIVGAFSSTAGELTLAYDAGSDLTTVSGDVDGDGVADFQFLISGDHTGFANFVL